MLEHPEFTQFVNQIRLGDGHPRTLNAMANLAVTYRKIAKNDLALLLLDESLKWRKAKLGADHKPYDVKKYRAERQKHPGFKPGGNS